MTNDRSRGLPDAAKYTIAGQSAARLASLMGVPKESLSGLTIDQVRERFPIQLNPRWFWFEQICGTVVKTDPGTGVAYPVPYATVDVDDTECSFLGYFPASSPWAWHFPIRCTTHVIATTRTDACGKFCVWVPRWDIEWVLRYRLERRCYPVILQRPTLGDIIRQLVPQGDPATLGDHEFGRLVNAVAEKFGGDAAAQVAGLRSSGGFGASTSAAGAVLGAPARLSQVRPPLPAELRVSAAAGDRVHPGVATLAGRLGVKAKDLASVDPRRWMGPFMRCHDVIVPEWVPILEVPDISITVLQDTTGTGTPVPICGPVNFGVSWETTPIGPLTLQAGPNALAGVPCGPTSIPCGDEPAIVTAGLLPVTGDPSVYDSVNGFAVRTNRPHPSGMFTDPLPLPAGQAPCCGDLLLYGCNQTDPGATQYRLVYTYSSDGGATFTAPTPFVGLTWLLYRLNGMGTEEWHAVSADAQGWYPIALPAGPNPWLPGSLLLDWDTTGFADGLYVVTLDLGSAGVVSSSAAPVAFTVNNKAPTGTFAVATASSAAGPFTPIDAVCPVVSRGATPTDVYFRVTLPAAGAHLRSVSMTASGCGAGDFVFISGTGGFNEPAGSTTYDYWHADVTVDAQALTAIYLLPASAQEGTYIFSGVVASRAFNPDGGDGGQHATPAWQYDPQDVYITPISAFSVINR